MIEHHKCASRLIRDDDLCAKLAPLDRYGLADFASVLVDGVLALANRSKDAGHRASKASTKPNA
jgi:hypothetical protein